MSKTKNLKMIYPILGSALALCGTGALFLGLLGTWIAFLLGANVFIAAGLVCGTEIKTVRKKNPFAQFSEDEPEELEGRMLRVPYLSPLAALLAALLAGFISGSALAGLLVFFTWGGLGLPLAACVLTRTDFGLSLQTGLISSVVFTAIGGAIQVLLSSPGHSFDLKYCLETVADGLKASVTAALTEFQSLVQTQSEALGSDTELLKPFLSVAPAELAEQSVHLFLSVTPALFAVAVLSLSCVLWWGMKAALKKDTAVEVKYMGRLDGYRPGAILSPLYLVFVLANMFSATDSALQIASMNLVYVISAVLTFAGFSVILYFINTKAPSVAVRVLLTIVTAVVGLSSCGGSLLLLLGLFSASRDLRGMFGGGTYR